MCTTLAHTANAGRTWQARGTLPAPVAGSGEPGVSGVHLDRRGVGFAFGPDLYSTHDGGQQWQTQRLPGDGQRVLALGVSRGIAQMVVSPCAINTPDSDCTAPSTLWWAPLAPMRAGLDPYWTRADVDLPATSAISLDSTARSSYLTVQHDYPAPDELYASTNGVNWSSRSVPCTKEDGNSVLRAVAPSSSRTVGLLCLGDAGFGKATKELYRSDDTGRTTQSAGEAPRAGIESALALSPSGTLIVASTGDQSVLHRNTMGTVWSTPFQSRTDGPGWNDPLFTTASTGYVIEGNTARGGSTAGTVLATHDSGAHWAPLVVDLDAASG